MMSTRISRISASWCTCDKKLIAWARDDSKEGVGGLADSVSSSSYCSGMSQTHEPAIYQPPRGRRALRCL